MERKAPTAVIIPAGSGEKADGSVEWRATSARSGWSLLFIWSVSFVWLNQTD
jgi:hypothetical protein